VTFLLQGSSQDIYIHWFILVLGIGILLSGALVLISCRSIATRFNLLGTDDSSMAGFYRRFLPTILPSGLFFGLSWQLI